MTRICIGKLTIIVSDNGLSPGRRQAIIWSNAGILLIGPSGTNFSAILIEIQTFPSKKIRYKMSSAKCCPFRFGLNVLISLCGASLINTLSRPRQNGRHFPDNILKCIFLNENIWISFKISLNVVLTGPINKIPALVQIMAWRRSGDKPWSGNLWGSAESVNPLRAKFFKGNINIYLHFMSFLHIDMTQVLKILPQVRGGPTYSIKSISWLLMSWRR